jgi:hypothetical protein
MDAESPMLLYLFVATVCLVATLLCYSIKNIDLTPLCYEPVDPFYKNVCLREQMIKKLPIPANNHLYIVAIVASKRYY